MDLTDWSSCTRHEDRRANLMLTLRLSHEADNINPGIEPTAVKQIKQNPEWDIIFEKPCVDYGIIKVGSWPT